MSVRPHTSRRGTTTYQVRFRHNGRQTSETFPTERAAIKFDQLVKKIGPGPALNVLAHRQGIVDDEVPTVAQQVAAHIDGLTHITPGTERQYRIIERGIAASHLGALPIDAVTRADVAAWLKTMQDSGRSSKTIRNYQALLSTAIGQAVLEERIATNPAEKHKVRRTERRRANFLTYDQFGALVAATPDHYRPLLWLLVSTGLRIGEAIALPIRDLALDARPDPTLTVTRAWKSGGGFGPPKTRKGERTLSMPADVAAMLAPLVAGRGRDELVLLNTAGGMITQTSLYDGWKRWRVAAGLPDTIRLHDLRHTHASWMLAQGMSLFDLQHRLGHESIKTTADVYGHLMPEASAVAARAASLALAQVHVPAQIEA